MESQPNPSQRTLLNETNWYILYIQEQMINDYISWLVGGFNPFEKYARQIGNLPQIGGENKKYLSCHHLVDFNTSKQRGSGTPWITCQDSRVRFTVQTYWDV